MVDTAFEGDHLAQRMPIVHPTPAVELRSIAAIQLDRLIVANQTQHEPHLFLTDANRFAVPADIPARQSVAQPPARLSHDLDMVGQQAHLFLKLAEHRLLWRLVRLDAPLRKLPRILPGAAGPKDAPLSITQDNADIQSISI